MTGLKRRAAALCAALTVLCAALPVAAQGGPSAEGPDLAALPLLFVRDGVDPAQVPASAVSILMVGDVSFARHVREATTQHGMAYPLELVTPWLQAPDLAVGNYEGVIAAEGVGERRYGRWRLRADPPAAQAVADAGFDLVTLANNHTMDWGPGGFSATLDHLHAAGVETVGAGEGKHAAQAPLVTTVRGVRIVWLAFTLVPDPPNDNRDRDDGWTRSIVAYGDLDSVTQAVRAARPLGDALIVQFHWGDENIFCPNNWQIDMGRAAIDAGASLVISHHPHVVQRFEPYGAGFIAYSLGNFLFDQDARPGMAVWIRADRQGVVDVHGLALVASSRPAWEPERLAAVRLTNWCGSKVLDE
ncbi:MAG: CapA family protein [Anaerolineales bacterium]|nr:CapA family protein [Anaerolineales bacterium]